MLGPYKEFAQYGTQTTFLLAFEDVTDAQAPYVGVPPVIGDIWISIDGGAAANATNAVIAVGSGIYSWTATAAELAGSRIAVSIYDSDASALFLPLFLVVQTRLDLGSVSVNASGISGNLSAVTLLGKGTGDGINTTGGATGNGIAASGGATSGNGLQCTGVDTGNGILTTGGTDGAGLSAVGGGGVSNASSGILAVGFNGIRAEAATTDGEGIQAFGLNAGYGFRARGGATGGGILAAGGATSGAGFTASGSGNSPGISAVGSGTAAGLRAVGGVSGAGISATGGSTSGSGVLMTASGGNLPGLIILGQGSGNGAEISGGLTGNGLVVSGGGTSGSGIIAQATSAAADGYGISVIGKGTGDGIRTVGGATGTGIRAIGGATSGAGISASGTSGDSEGLLLVGANAGPGLSATGGVTAAGLYARSGATSGAGIQAVAQTLGNGITATGAGVGGTRTNFFDDTYPDVAAAPAVGTTSLKAAIGFLMARFFNKVTQTQTTQSLFDSGDVVRTTAPMSDNGVTQTKGKFV